MYLKHKHLILLMDFPQLKHLSNKSRCIMSQLSSVQKIFKNQLKCILSIVIMLCYSIKIGKLKQMPPIDMLKTRKATNRLRWLPKYPSEPIFTFKGKQFTDEWKFMRHTWHPLDFLRYREIDHVALNLLGKQRLGRNICQENKLTRLYI